MKPFIVIVAALLLLCFTTAASAQCRGSSCSVRVSVQPVRTALQARPVRSIGTRFALRRYSTGFFGTDRARVFQRIRVRVRR